MIDAIAQPGLEITEGVSGLWHYHLSESREQVPIVALCGARVMHTSMRLESWRVPFGEHFPKRPTWCAECEKRMTSR